MTLINEIVKHEKLGEGTIVDFDNEHIAVQFRQKTAQFVYPDAFENFLTFEKPSLNEEVNKLIESKLADKKKEIAAIIRNYNDEKNTPTKKPNKKTKKEMFGEDYNVDYLKLSPVYTYQEVESKFGIKITGFGRGINPTENSIVLISNISKKNDNFVYHDRWTNDGDYLYSGEGKNGDQTFTKGNKEILNASKNCKPIHLFVKFSSKEYIYQGIFNLVNYTFEDEEDELGHIRKEIKFRLRKANND